ncbi:30S ribosomal protein S3 [Candidatus Woesearchaeota archaeon]|nr:30S ribosomal protein S3 [Candidatus Woesearchaeota archaeon]
MIERDFVKQKKKEFQIEEFVSKKLKNVGHSHTKMQRTPLGEKIVIAASRPGLVVGREGQNIKSMTIALKKKFKLENPQIEIQEVEDINLDPKIVAEYIASSLERFGPTRFKGIGHKVMDGVMKAGALGVEIKISGKIPSARAKNWRFYSGYLKKCGDVAISGVKSAYANAELKSGMIGIQVKIMPPDLRLPDDIRLIKEKEVVVEEITEGEGETKAIIDAKEGEKAGEEPVPEKPAEEKIEKTEEKETEDKGTENTK